MGECWSFRGDNELDPILKKWSKQHEKSFHIRQALRSYTRGGSCIGHSVDVEHEAQGVEPEEVGVSFDEYR